LNYLEHFPFASINMEPQHKMVQQVRWRNQAVLVTLYLTPAAMFVRQWGMLTTDQFYQWLLSLWLRCYVELSSVHFKCGITEFILGDAARFVIMPPLQFELASMPSESGITNIRQSNQAVLVTLYLIPSTMFVRVSINLLKTGYDKN
ncbi:hypothetical protein T09_3398, partial [Trichinella sp. T9]